MKVTKQAINFLNVIAEELGSESKSFLLQILVLDHKGLILNINLKEYLHVICNIWISFYGS